MLRLGRGEEKARATRLRLAARCTGTVRAGARHRRCRCTGTAAPAVPRCTTVQAFGPHRRCRCRPPAYSCTLVHGVHLHRVYCGWPAMRLRGPARKTPGKADLRSRALRRFGRSHGAATASAFAPLLAASTRPVAPAATAVARSDVWVVICRPLVPTRRRAKGEARWPGGR